MYPPTKGIFQNKHRTKMVDLFAMFDDWGDKLSELKQT